MTECVQLRQQKLGPDHPDTKSAFIVLHQWQEEDRDPFVPFNQVKLLDLEAK